MVELRLDNVVEGGHGGDYGGDVECGVEEGGGRVDLEGVGREHFHDCSG